MPSICTPPALQIVDQLTTLSSKLLAQSISIAQSTCIHPQRDACRDVVLAQRTHLDSLSLVMMGPFRLFLHPFRPPFGAAKQAGIHGEAEKAEVADVEQMK